VVRVTLSLAVIAGFMVLGWHFKTLVRFYWELVEPVWLAMRKLIGNVVVHVGLWFLRLGACFLRFGARVLEITFIFPKVWEIERVTISYMEVQQ